MGHTSGTVSADLSHRISAAYCLIGQTRGTAGGVVLPNVTHITWSGFLGGNVSNREPPGWVSALTMLLGLTAGVWGLWCVVIGFVGGTMPLIGIEVEGSVILGLFMLFIGEPILLTVAYWASMAVMLPIILVTTRRRAG